MGHPHIQLVPSRRSLAVWAVIAAAFVIFSYVFTLIVAFLCVYLPYLALLHTDFVAYQEILLLICGIAIAIIVVWSLLPRRDQFPVPGPILDRERHPRLFAEIDQMAAAFQEPIPRAVYLTFEVNAWVAQRGGIMGIGSKRVMGIGLPVLQVLTISQFRAVLAHEFGHYYQGDTRLGPWVYTARSAMVRTLENLGGDSAFLAAVSRIGLARLALALVLGVLGWYWRLFMRITQLVSRKQEYRADELACAVAGASAMADGLQILEGSTEALTTFWFTEVVPSIEAGYRPRICEGFGRFLLAPHIAAGTQECIASALKDSVTSAYDTHPPLGDRVAAMRLLGAPERAELRDKATTLLNAIDDLEMQIVGFMAPQFDAKNLKPLEWEEVGIMVYVPTWERTVSEYPSLLDAFTVGSLPEALEKLPAFTSAMRDPPGTLLTREQRMNRASNLLWMALALALVNEGWKVQSEPGQFGLLKGDQRINPIISFSELRSGLKSAESWRQWTKECGISGIPLRARP